MNLKIKNKKLILISIVAFLIIIAIIPCIDRLDTLGSIYSISKLENAINDVEIGDTIEYEINGYSDWQVLYMDKENNTIDVVSKTNVKDLSLSGDDYKNAVNIFQEEANNYTDDKYAIKARSVTRSDLEHFAFSEEFWTSDIYDGKIATNKSMVEPKKDAYYSFYITFFVYIGEFEEADNYNNGDTVVFNDVEYLIIKNASGQNSIRIVPKHPLKIELNQDNIKNINSNYIYTLLDSRYHVSSIPNMNFWVPERGGSEDLISSYDFIRESYHNSGYDGIYAYVDSLYYYTTDEGEKLRFEGTRLDENGSYYWYEGYNSTHYYPTTYGFRPVVTLKYSNKKTNQKKINENISIGDNVNYQANEYQNWKVLSYDNEKETVDLISGGIVENLYLYGEEDYNNYEQKLQEKVDKYKSGDNVVSARSVKYSDLSNLNAINDKVSAKYWLKNKKQYNRKESDSETSSPYNMTAFYDVAIMSYNQESNKNEREYVSIYIDCPGGSMGLTGLTPINGIGDLSYTAGIRPVITVKTTGLKKISDEELKKINAKTASINNTLVKTQGRDTTKKSNNSSKKDSDKKEDKTNIEESKNTEGYETCKSNNCCDKKEELTLLKYILGGIIFLDIIAVIISITSVFILIQKKKML